MLLGRSEIMLITLQSTSSYSGSGFDQDYPTGQCVAAVNYVFSSE